MCSWYTRYTNTHGEEMLFARELLLRHTFARWCDRSGLRIAGKYKLHADSRKLRGDVESRGVPSEARTLLQGPRLSKTPRCFRESASS